MQGDFLDLAASLTDEVFERARIEPLIAEEASAPCETIVGTEKSAEVSERPQQHWNTEMAELIEWFKTTSLPEHPFNLRDGHTIVDTGKWQAFIESDIEAGPRGREGVPAYYKPIWRPFVLHLI